MMWIVILSSFNYESILPDLIDVYKIISLKDLHEDRKKTENSPMLGNNI